MLAKQLVKVILGKLIQLYHHFRVPEQYDKENFASKVDGVIVQPDLQLPVAEMIGHLMYLMSLLDIQVTRHFSFATLLMLCDYISLSVDLSSGVDPATRAALEKDFRIGWGRTWSLLAPIRTSYVSATNLVTRLKNNQLGDQLGWTFNNFTLQESTWKQQVEDKIGAIIYNYFFSGKFEIGRSLRNDFYLATTATTDTKKRIITSALNNLTAENLQIMFSGKNVMEASEFLNKCIFISIVPSKLTEMFKDCIHCMTYGERSRLAIFITRNEYFGGKNVTVDLTDTNDNPLITSSTCFEKLNLPHYQDLDTMYRKICYSIMDRSFGNM